jgi:outer membrane protein assembly factor BamB
MRNTTLTRCALLGSLLLLDGHSLRAQDWPQWRGPNRDNKVTGFTAPRTWPKELTKKWQKPVGFGAASPVLVGDKLYVFTRQGGDEVVTCLNAADGEIVWQDKYAVPPVTPPASMMGGSAGGPIGTPAVAEGKVCTVGARGVVSCLDAATGKVVWRKDTKSWPRFFLRTSPLIVGGKCIAYVGGSVEGKIIAYDLASGEAKWTWTGEAPSFGSPVLMTVADTRQVVTFTVKSLIGVTLADGKLLWQVPFQFKYNSATPMIDGQTVIVSVPIGGTAAFRVEKQGIGFTARQLWKKPQAAAQYITPVRHDGLLFGVSASRNFFCTDARTGDLLWTDTTKRGDGGAVLDAGSVILALTSDTYLVAFQPSGKGYTEVARYKVAQTPPWACPVIAGNRVFVKDHDTLALWTID